MTFATQISPLLNLCCLTSLLAYDIKTILAQFRSSLSYFFQMQRLKPLREEYFIGHIFELAEL